jgi:hypothetical protein
MFSSRGGEAEMHYTFAQHLLSDEIWAAQIDDNRAVIAIAGPLPASEISDSQLPSYDYRSDPVELRDFNQRAEDFRWGLVPDAAESESPRLIGGSR